MRILYGVEIKKDITYPALLWCLQNDHHLRIPESDNERAAMFSDPIPNVKKSIYIEHDDGRTDVYDGDTPIDILVTDSSALPSRHETIHAMIRGLTGEDRLREIHRQILFKGNLNEEYPEQLMSCLFLPSDAKVLEIGANIGRNTLVIASILEDDKNLVTLETMAPYAEILEVQKQLNGFGFHIVNAALSRRRLAQQSGGWTSYPVEDGAILQEGEIGLSLVTFDELQQRYDIVFDTLILDCEGAFYYILLDFPHMLDHIRLVIMENDYTDIAHKQYVDEQLRSSGFECIYVANQGGWGPCASNFFETWQKKI